MNGKPLCSVGGCSRPIRYKAAQLCGLHYQRRRKTGDPLGRLDEVVPLERRFWDKVDRSEGCWLWTAGVSANGYGRIQIAGRDGPGVDLAHRVSWRLSTGVDPSGLVVMHLCDTPRCVRPSHLVLGMQAANVYDMTRKGRTRSRKAS